jgi:solute:Na+ symporter, SSS family
MPTAHVIDLVVVALYLIAVTVVGCLMSRKTQTANAFMSAGGSLPGWVVGLSIVGTFVSSISFIANPGKSFGGNWNPFVFSLSLPYAALVATVFFVPYFRSGTSLSAYEHLEHRFGAWARLYAAVFNILYHIGRIGTILFGVSLAASPLIDMPISAVIVGLGVLVVAYTLLGGIEAVIWTDVVQSVILIAGMLICAGLLIMKVDGGIIGIIEGAQQPAENKLSLGSLAVDFSIPSFWTVLVFGFVINLQNFAADQTFVQRYFTAKSHQDATRSVWMGAIAYLPISAVLFFIGTGLYVFYSSAGTLPPETLADGVLPHFIMTELPTGLAGLLVAAILAAAMSTVDSSLNSSATLLLCDIKNRFFGSHQNDTADLIFLRITTVFLGVAGIGAALAMIGVKQILDVWWQVSGVLSGGTLGLILLARFTKASGGRGAGIGVIAGVVAMGVIVIAHMQQPPDWLLPLRNSVTCVKDYLHPLMAIVVGTAMVLLCGVLFSRRAENGSSGL